MRNVGIVGFGQSHFTKSRFDVTFPELVREGAAMALTDAQLTMADVQAVVFPLAPDALIGVGHGERWCVEAVGAQGKPFMRINTGGATGLTAVQAGYMHIASGMFDVVLVAGADRVSESNSAQSVLNKMWDVAYERLYPLNTSTMLALSAQRYNQKYGADESDMARVTVKDRQHAALNPHAHMRTPVTVRGLPGNPVDFVAAQACRPVSVFDGCRSSCSGQRGICQAAQWPGCLGAWHWPVQRNDLDGRSCWPRCDAGPR